MFHATPSAPFQSPGSIPHVIAIRRDEQGFDSSDVEDELLKGPVFETLPEALAWIEELDRLRDGN